MIERRMALGVVVALMTQMSCSGVSVDPGTDALIQIHRGSFVRGDFPDPSGGPSILGAYLTQTTLRPGEQDKSYSGIAEARATAVLIMMERDVGYFRVPTGLAPPETPHAVGFVANFSLSRHVAPGNHVLLTAAVDERGRVGQAVAVDFRVAALEQSASVLDVRLLWEGPADLDLHLVLPDGREIFEGDPVLREGGEIVGALDFDSNAECAFDGRGGEIVSFEKPPPVGTYAVRVETRSLCNATSAPFSVEVSLSNEAIVSVQGVALPSDTRFAGGRGAGRLMTTFQVP